MKSLTVRRAAVLATAGACALVSAGTAAAATTPFGCTASVVRGTTAAPLSLTEHYEQANPAVTPCSTDSSTGDEKSYSLGSFSVTVQKSGAYTGSSTSAGAAAELAPSAGAQASINGAEITYPAADGTTQTVQWTQSSATATSICVAGKDLSAGFSDVGDVLVNGQSVASAGQASDETQPTTIDLPDSGGATLLLNQQVTSGGALTQDAVTFHSPTLGDLVIEEASVTAGTCPTLTLPGLPSVTQCPAGAVFNPLSLTCVTVGLPKVTVSNPFAGPSGGTVIPLEAAQFLYPGNPCVTGAGPNYVIVATPNSTVINGTNGADRILGLGYGDRINGLNGNDCIDTGDGNDALTDGRGNDRITAGNGKDTVKAGNGRDTVTAGNGRDSVKLGNGKDTVKLGNGRDSVKLGNGKDTIKVGNGRDTITAGRGSDTVTVGSGVDRVTLGSGKDRVRTGKGKDRVSATGTAAKVSCLNRKDLVFLKKGSATKWAKAHGCVAIKAVR